MAGAVPTVGKGSHVSPQLSFWEVLGAHIQEQFILQQHMSPSGTQSRADTHSLRGGQKKMSPFSFHIAQILRLSMFYAPATHAHTHTQTLDKNLACPVSRPSSITS
jgi:hypothetical protein